VIPLQYLKIGGAVAFLLLAMFAWGAWERGSAAKAELAAFTASVQAAGEQAIQRRKVVEDANKKRLQNARAGWATSLACLRDDTCAGRSSVPIVPTPPSGTAEICYDQTKLAEAVERYRKRVQGLVTEGQLAQADAVALLAAWPEAK